MHFTRTLVFFIVTAITLCTTSGQLGVFASPLPVDLSINVPINVCGNSVNIIGILNPAFGNTCQDQETL